MEANNILSMKFEKGKNESKVIISYFVPEIKRNRTDEVTDMPHQDFFGALSQLNDYLAKVFYVEDENKSLFSATGFKFSSENKVIITGKVVTSSGSIVGIATPSINLDEDVYGFEDHLNEDIEYMVSETYSLLMAKKLGVKQMTIDDAIDQAEKDANTEDDHEDDFPDINSSEMSEDLDSSDFMVGKE